MLGRLKVLFCICLCNLCGLWLMVEGQKAKKSRKPKANGSRPGINAHYGTGMYLCLGIFLLCILPAVGVFLYNLYRDPLTPELFQRLIESVKNNMLRNLSSSSTSAASSAGNRNGKKKQ